MANPFGAVNLIPSSLQRFDNVFTGKLTEFWFFDRFVAFELVKKQVKVNISFACNFPRAEFYCWSIRRTLLFQFIMVRSAIFENFGRENDRY